MNDDRSTLEELARLYHIQTEYLDTAGGHHRAETDVLYGVLRAMGSRVDGPGDLAAAIVARRREIESRWLEPVAIAWDGATTVVPIRPQVSGWLDCLLTLETGEESRWTVAPDVDRIGLEVRGPLPIGYHKLRVETAGRSLEALILAAPTRAFDGGPRGVWGLFCPLYALHRERSWGAGDFGDLGALIDWTADRGGGLVATLPMLAATFDDRPWISPYSPTSRLFWNEFYLDLDAIPRFSRSGPVRELIDSPDFAAEIASLRAEPLVDYARQMRLKRRAIETFLRSDDSGPFEASESFRRFLETYPEAPRYAGFMARVERLGPDWWAWPLGLDEVPVDEAMRYHLFVQWQADMQLRALADRAESRGLTWYVDFTVGVDPRSYDVWSRPEVFARDASVGCPPDEGFTTGQNWGFPPLHPDRQREDGYAYLIASLRNHFRYAKAVRLDHVMGLHRLYWIPEGRKSGGCYVEYPADEIYAILTIESSRRGAWVVGEDLGTVPPSVRPAMHRHAIRRLYVLQHSLAADDDFTDVPPDAVASINTHDMPTFLSYWQGRDIEERVDLGLLNEQVAARERAARPKIREALVKSLIDRGLLDRPESDDVAALYSASAALVAGSPAPVLILNIEDLWLEPEPQNMPGTIAERPNWRRKARLGLDEIAESPRVAAILGRVDERRRDVPHGRP